MVYSIEPILVGEHLNNLKKNVRYTLGHSFFRNVREQIVLLTEGNVSLSDNT